MKPTTRKTIMHNSSTVVYGVLAGIAMMLAWMLMTDFADVITILSHQ